MYINLLLFIFRIIFCALLWQRHFRRVLGSHLLMMMCVLLMDWVLRKIIYARTIFFIQIFSSDDRKIICHTYTNSLLPALYNPYITYMYYQQSQGKLTIKATVFFETFYLSLVVSYFNNI